MRGSGALGALGPREPHVYVLWERGEVERREADPGCAVLAVPPGAARALGGAPWGVWPGGAFVGGGGRGAGAGEK